jgi:hypothetical protein
MLLHSLTHISNILTHIFNIIYVTYIHIRFYLFKLRYEISSIRINNPQASQSLIRTSEMIHI